jgi:hypothetical protein
MRTWLYTGAVAVAMAAAIACTESNPAAPTSSGPLARTASEPGEPPFGPEQPPFNLQAILRPLGESGFGHVKFRQPNDDARVVYLDVWVRDLAPDTDYSLQRAVDVVLDGQCTSAGWLTLGQGLDPQPISTDEKGTGQAALFRDLGAFAVGSAFDIHFRVVQSATLTPVLQSGCYRYVITQ